MDAGITLQVNLAPSDLPHAIHTIPHQLRRWRAQVDEVLLTVDLRRSTGTMQPLGKNASLVFLS